VKNDIKRICVYCGSSSGKKPDYAQQARSLAEHLLEQNIGLVYGGANIGIMGEVANAVLQGGGEVMGIIPKSLARKEVAHFGLSDLRVVDSMHQRKTIMADESDGFIALPGGIGTLEELFEILTWAQLGFHQKPCGLLNVESYYDDLERFLNKAVDQGFVRKQHRDMLLIKAEPAELLTSMLQYRAPKMDKWIDRDQT